MIEIKLAGLNDLEAILKLAVGFRNSLERTDPTEDNFREGITILINSDDAEFILLQDDNNNTAGYILQRYFYSMWLTGFEARIEDLFVHPDERGKGYGKALVEYAIKRGKENECKSIFLDTNENNVSSNNIYRSLGFNEKSKRWNGGRQILYRLSLL